MEFVRLVREAGLAEPWCQTFLPFLDAFCLAQVQRRRGGGKE